MADLSFLTDGSHEQVVYVTHRAARTAQPAALCAAALAALEIVAQEPARRAVLLTNAAALRERLRQQGWRVPGEQSQIIPLIVGEPAQAVALSKQLWERGLFVPAIRPPSVPIGGSLLRISLSYSHSVEMIDTLVTALSVCHNGK